MKKLKSSELPRYSVEEYKDVEKIAVVAVLDNLRSLLNVGSVFRTADAFAIQEVVLCGYTGRPPHPEIHKSALGATDSVPWRHFETTLDALAELKANGFRLIAIEHTADSRAIDSFSFERGQKYALVFGNEVKGVAQEVLDACELSIEIPQGGTKHSLNVSVCAGVVLWEAYRQMR